MTTASRSSMGSMTTGARGETARTSPRPVPEGEPMSDGLLATTEATRRTDRPSRAEGVTVTQFRVPMILTVWAAATVPMAVLAWVVAPAFANAHSAEPLARSLPICLTIGLVWQAVLVVGVVAYEQRSLRWSRLRPALWLTRPRSPRTGRRGGRVWLAAIPFVIGFGIRQLIPAIPHAAKRDLGKFLATPAAHTMFHGSWAWFALAVTMLVFNTVLGEELLFRGLLLPRMHDAFGERDWIANGVLFAGYHLHMPWMIPVTLLDTFLIAYPTKRYRSAWMGIIVHSSQTVVFTILLLTLVT